MGFLHSRAGRCCTPWEEVFCHVYGMYWRQRRDQCARAAEWREGESEFVLHVCSLWGLPGPIQHSVPVALASASDSRRFCTLENEPPRVHHDDDNFWVHRSRRLCITVDCRALAEILNGRAALWSSDLRPLFVRISRLLAQLLQCGVRPRVDTADLIEWRPRSYNAVADHYCNIAMDSQTSKAVLSKVAVCEAWSGHHNLHLYTDGGVRPSHAATGWVLYSVSSHGSIPIWTKTCWAFNCLSNSDVTPFLSECLALEDALVFLQQAVAS